MFAALGLEWREPKDRDGVQVETLYKTGAGGAQRLEGRVVPVPSDFEQRQRAILQQQRIQALEVKHSWCKFFVDQSVLVLRYQPYCILCVVPCFGCFEAVPKYLRGSVFVLMMPQP